MNLSDNIQAVRVWDAFVRVFHWSLVSCVLLNYFVVDDGEDLHQWLGYIAVGLVVARIVWGFVGTKYARFADFLPTPSRLVAHVKLLLARQPDHHLGHNPLGAVMILFLITVVMLLGVSGYLQTTDMFFGEEWLQETHEILASTLIGLAGMHVLAAIVMSLLEQTNLVKAMITGFKTRRVR